jgi:hypothetical protein
MVLENCQIVPTIMKANNSKDKISLTPIPPSQLNGERSKENHSEHHPMLGDKNGCL